MNKSEKTQIINGCSNEDKAGEYMILDIIYLNFSEK